MPLTVEQLIAELQKLPPTARHQVVTASSDMHMEADVVAVRWQGNHVALETGRRHG